MSLATVGPWILFSVGCLTLLGAGVATVLTMTKADVRRPWLMWVFGMAAAGVGLHGTAFLEPYGEFIGVLQGMQEDPSEETYSAFFGAVADGELPASLQAAGTAYALRHPIDGMGDMLERYSVAAKNVPERELLRNAKAEHAAQRVKVDTIIGALGAGGIKPGTVRRFDEPTRMMVERRLEGLSNEELSQFSLAPGDVERFRLGVRHP